MKTHCSVRASFLNSCPLPIMDLQGYTTLNLTVFGVRYVSFSILLYALEIIYCQQWQFAHPENYNAFSGLPLHPHNLSDSRYDLNASTAHMLKFDRLSVPVTVAQVEFYIFVL